MLLPKNKPLNRGVGSDSIPTGMESIKTFRFTSTSRMRSKLEENERHRRKTGIQA